MLHILVEKMLSWILRSRNLRYRRLSGEKMSSLTSSLNPLREHLLRILHTNNNTMYHHQVLLRIRSWNARSRRRHSTLMWSPYPKLWDLGRLILWLIWFSSKRYCRIATIQRQKVPLSWKIHHLSTPFDTRRSKSESHANLWVYLDILIEAKQLSL